MGMTSQGFINLEDVRFIGFIEQFELHLCLMLCHV